MVNTILKPLEVLTRNVVPRQVAKSPTAADAPSAQQAAAGAPGAAEQPGSSQPGDQPRAGAPQVLPPHFTICCTVCSVVSQPYMCASSVCLYFTTSAGHLSCCLFT